jgi:glycosyltransferase involved in cell wall biosynthesis
MITSKNKKPRILIIASSFAPSTAVGAKRFIFLSPILKNYYNNLFILTLKEKYYPSKDYSLPISGNIYRVGMYPPYTIRANNFIGKIYNQLWRNYFCLVDSFSGWILPGLLKGLRIVKKNKIDLIIATCPQSSSIVTGFLISFITNTKLIIDYRDPWTLKNSSFPKIFRSMIGRFLEKLAIRQAAAIVFCTQIMRKDFLENLGKYTKAICRVVHSGFHDRDMVQPLSLGKGKKIMIYSGNFYSERRFKLLAKPLSILFNKGFIGKDSFCFHIFGKTKNEDKEMINQYGLKELVEWHPPVNYEQIIRYLKGADILFLPSGSDVKYAIPYKFYDYLSVKRPILAVAPEDSAVADMMREIDCGTLSLINDEDSILENLRKMLLEENEYSYSGAEKFTWENIANRYIDVIDKVCGLDKEQRSS